MKISHMLLREDFYSINRRTLEMYYGKKGKSRRLYIYPKLNAIVPANTGAAVRKYLYTEYRVSGSAVKRLLVQTYCRCLLWSRGLLASAHIDIVCNADKNTLIYPCNKKYRVFHFGDNTVDVIGKDGFPSEDLQREKIFRKTHGADFIPPLQAEYENGYTEKIIDGYPLARAGGKTEELAERAYKMWREYVAGQMKTVPAEAYMRELSIQVDDALQTLCRMGKEIPYEQVRRYAAHLAQFGKTDCTVTVCLSHGDLQAGNIWVERGTGKIRIIDWESYGLRSEAYDKATLFCNIRKDSGLAAYAAQPDCEKAIVLMEDLLFRLNEVRLLPRQFGKEDFVHYMRIVEGKTVYV